MRNSLVSRARAVAAARPRRTVGAAVGAGAVLFGLLAIPGATADDDTPASSSAASLAFGQNVAHSAPAPTSEEISKVRVTRNEVPVPAGGKAKVTVTVDSPEAGNVWVYLDRVHYGDMGPQWANGPLPGLKVTTNNKDCVFFTDPDNIGIGTAFKCPTPAGVSKVTFKAKVPAGTPAGSVAFFDAYHQVGSSMWNAGSFSGGFGVG